MVDIWAVPVMVPPVIVQVDEENNPAGLDAIAQVVSLVLKPVPVTFTVILRGP